MISTGFVFSQTLHFVNRMPWEGKPTTPEALKQKIIQIAEQYKQFAPVPRVGFVDIAFPRDESEANSLGGYAVLLVTAICQDRAELPLRYVRVEAAGQSRVLEFLGAVSSTVADDGTAVASTFGRNQVDALYLLPIYAANEKGIITADFAANRNGFRLYELSVPKDEYARKIKQWPPQEIRPDATALKEFIKREYPGFLAD
ncbi:MAG: hypothetical protein ABSG73_04135 [Candidatus Aminicenantales bacterium]|jgi:hypothetical protein